MKRYEKYIDSGVEWLGEIPEHWKVISIKHLANGADTLFIDGNWIESDIITEDGIRYLTSGNIGPGFYKEQGSGYVSEETFNKNNFIEVFPGDLIISRLNEPIGRACIIPDLGKRIVTCVDNVILRPKSPFNKKYLMYLMNSKEYSALTSLISRGATMKRISRTILGQIRIPVPDGYEQTQIANYLDHQTSKTDELITEKESLIIKLQEKRKALINEVVTKGLNPQAAMKDSGIEWLGMIPEHWKINELRRYADQVQTGTTPSTEKNEYFENATFNWFTPSDFSDDKIFMSDSKRKVSKIAVDEQACRVFPENTVLLIGIGATLGKVGLSVEKCSANQQINAIVFNEKINSLFGAYYLSSIKEIVVSKANAATLAILNQSNTKEIPFVCPPIEEQSQIVNHIESRTTKIDQTVEELRTQIEKLKEYKLSVISEAVTGKVDVREWKTPKQT